MSTELLLALASLSCTASSRFLFSGFVSLYILTHSVLPCFPVISSIIVQVFCCTTVIQINGHASNTERSLKWISLALTFQAAEILQISL